MGKGWIKLHRSIADHPRFQDPQWLLVWIKILTLATHAPYKTVFNGKTIELQKGQFITSRKSLSEKTGVNESKVERILKTLKTEQQIEQVGGSVSRLITVTNWIQYQDGEQDDEQQVNNVRTTVEQQLNTNKKIKNEEEDKEVKISKRKPRQPFVEPSLEEVQEYAIGKGFSFDCAYWIDYWKQRDWKYKGGAKMVDWQAAVRTWDKNKDKFGGNHGTNQKPNQQYKSSQQRKDERLREVLAEYSSPEGSPEERDHLAVSVQPEGNPGE